LLGAPFAAGLERRIAPNIASVMRQDGADESAVSTAPRTDGRNLKQFPRLADASIVFERLVNKNMSL
jgi:hypothetical protein